MKQLLTLLLLVAVFALLKAGFTIKAMLAFLFAVFLIGVAFYFETRKAVEASKVEKVSANIWIILRRMICFIGAIFFGVFIVALEIPSGLGFFKEAGVRVILAIATMFCIWVGIYGRKSQVSTFKEDKDFHEKNKQRYKWPW